MRPTCWFLSLGLSVVLVLFRGDLPTPPAPPLPDLPAADELELFVRAPVPRDGGRPKRAFGPPSTYPRSAEAGRAVEVLDTAFARVWDQDDPREDAAELVQAMVNIDGAKGCDRAREVMTKLQKLKLDPQRRVVWPRLAAAVAAWDIQLRDELLWCAIADGQRSLKLDVIWAPEVFPPNVTPLGNPRTLRTFEKQSLEYAVRLWQAVLEYARDRDAGLNQASALFADAKAKGMVGLGCLIREYTYDLADILADLDPVLLLAVLPKVWSEDQVAQFCCGHATHHGKRDGITGKLINYALGRGVVGHLAEVAPYYDTTAALERARTLPVGTNDHRTPRFRALSVLLAARAWTDPDGALAIAESENPGPVRIDLIRAVGAVWAKLRPTELEPITKHIEDMHSRHLIVNEARAELAWRAQGKPPLDTYQKLMLAKWAHQNDRFRTGRHELTTRTGAHPDALRVLSNPNDSGWLTGGERHMRLYQAAEVAFPQSDMSHKFWDVVALFPIFHQPESGETPYVISNLAHHGQMIDAILRLRNVKSARWYCQAAVMVAREVAARPGTD